MTKIDLNEDEWSLIADAIEIAIGDIPDDAREGHPEDKRFWNMETEMREIVDKIVREAGIEPSGE